MSMDPEYLKYPRRRHGMDHDRYAFSMLAERPPVAWPDCKPPARSQSNRTPELLREAGIDWCADWVNDELPYAFNTDNGPLSVLATASA